MQKKFKTISADTESTDLICMPSKIFLFRDTDPIKVIRLKLPRISSNSDGPSMLQVDHLQLYENA